MKLTPATMLKSRHNLGRLSGEEGTNRKYAGVRTISEDGPSKYQRNWVREPTFGTLSPGTSTILFSGNEATNSYLKNSHSASVSSCKDSLKHQFKMLKHLKE
ncbi:hypothetical protein KIN20_026644 [Parelaphostrongylus tenuis]|uniref:Uncharacterized protein n=1 Tax=Parelaphostrongylus tenuis TaxID=148309 RepID=A0AAD5QY95_PARTN|nr:hypothetical protein KIN20_026644 [Parelaphostrongylus tenuis]